MKARQLWFILLVLFSTSLTNAGERVLTRSGYIVGKSLPRSTVFLGVPFAEPPVGALRWKAPKPVTPWRGDFPAQKFGSVCATLTPTKIVGSEDCLYLNVWVPAIGVNERLPVMVYIHGGGLMLGSAADPSFDGANLAERGRVIVVTIQYRLGEFGYMAHPALSRESAYGGSGNYGMMDQIASLTWVKDNIAAFGGDASNVTVFSESGGAASACALLASPRTKGLFSRVILESMSCPAIGKGLAEQEGLASAKAAGCEGVGDSTLACLRAKPLAAIMHTPSTEMVSRKDFRRMTSTLSVDGYYLPELPLELVRSGKGQHLPMLLGNNSAEGMFFVPFYYTPLTLLTQITAFFGPVGATQLYAHYPRELYSSTLAQAEAIFADSMFDCRARRLARAKIQGDSAPVYRYLYTFGMVMGGLTLPAVHTAETPFVFQRGAVLKGFPLNLQEARLEAAILSYWTSFARTGNPNASGTPQWDEFSPEKDNYLVLGSEIHPGSGRHRAQCDLWDRLDPR